MEALGFFLLVGLVFTAGFITGQDHEKQKTK